MQDLPTAFTKHLYLHANDSVVREMNKAYGWPSSEGGSVACAMPSSHIPANIDAGTPPTQSLLAEVDQPALSLLKRPTPQGPILLDVQTGDTLHGQSPLDTASTG